MASSNNPLDTFYNKSTKTETKKSKAPIQTGNKKMIIIVIAAVLAVCCLSSTCIGVLYATGAFDKVLNKDEDNNNNNNDDNGNKTTPTPTNKPDTTPTIEPTSKPTSTPSVAPTTPPIGGSDGKIGEWVSLSNVDWKVTKVEDAGKTITSSADYPDMTTTGTFLKVYITIKNNNSTNAAVMVPSLIGSDNTYEAEYITDDYLKSGETSMFINTVEANSSAEFVAIYDITGSTSGLKAEISDLVEFTGSYVYIELRN
jgi:hypothetical protein